MQSKPLPVGARSEGTVTRSMNILLCSFGSHGDMHPYLALGRELRLRGHGVTFATSQRYRELIESHGLAFAPLRPNLRGDDVGLMKRIMEPKRGGEELIRRLMMPAIRDTYQDLLAPAAKADLLVSHVLTFAVPILAEKTGQPWVSTALSPMVFFSTHDVPALAPMPAFAKLRCLSPRLNRWLFRLPRRVSQSWSRPAAELRRELGLPPGRDPLWEGLHSPHLGLAMFSPRFGPPQPDWPANVEVTGFPFLERPDEQPDAQLDRFLGGGERPIVFSLGSSAVNVAGDFYATAARATQRLGRRAVLVAGAGANALRAGLPATITAIEWANHQTLFPQVAAVVHHGGVGTTAEALRAGVPQLVVPFAHDQFDNGERVRRMGCGSVLFRSRVTEQRLTQALGQLLADVSAARTAQLESRSIRQEAGAVQAAEAIIRRFT
jgi:rhamnosyltransferase subunit B